jgi:hypothetical protein
MNRKIYIGIAIAVVLIALWMWWSKKSKKQQPPQVIDDSVIEDPTPLSVGEVAPEETDVAWSAQELEEEPTTVAIKEE